MKSSSDDNPNPSQHPIIPGSGPHGPDQVFLEGPRSRTKEFFTLFRVMRDFLRGFRMLHFVGPCVTVFGSARMPSSAST